MEITDSIFIRGKAQNLVDSCWNRRVELWRGLVQTIDQFLAYAPAKIAENLGLKITEAWEIPDYGILQGRKSSVEVLGMLDRRKKLIVVAGKHGFERRRFTLAHEIAHYELHPGLVLHREISLNGAANHIRQSREEHEANLFGAELLMPSMWVREQFMARFAEIMDGSRKNEALFYWLEQQELNLNRGLFFAADPRNRAFHIAKARYCYGQPFIPLCDFFRVSPSALAIQLVDLGLVK